MVSVPRSITRARSLRAELGSTLRSSLGCALSGTCCTALSASSARNGNRRLVLHVDGVAEARVQNRGRRDAGHCSVDRLNGEHSGCIGVGLQIGLVELDDVDACADQVGQFLLTASRTRAPGSVGPGSGRPARAG